MIYTRFGIKFEIDGKLEGVELDHLSAPVTLVRSKDGHFQFAEFLRADDGLSELMTEVNKADELNLSDDELKAAVREAS
jgi:hypothetical protein